MLIDSLVVMSVNISWFLLSWQQLISMLLIYFTPKSCLDTRSKKRINPALIFDQRGTVPIIPPDWFAGV
jgi:hypothetical protein